VAKADARGLGHVREGERPRRERPVAARSRALAAVRPGFVGRGAVQEGDRGRDGEPSSRGQDALSDRAP
jgi:hypothetical protein